MKMLMILSSDCSNHTIIYRAYAEGTTETGSRRDEGQWMEQSENKVSAVLKFKTYSGKKKKHGETIFLLNLKAESSLFEPGGQ